MCETYFEYTQHLSAWNQFHTVINQLLKEYLYEELTFTTNIVNNKL